jgi:hypothetical protein
MKRVTGIGGIFFKAKDAPALQAWYKRHLGIDVREWGRGDVEQNQREIACRKRSVKAAHEERAREQERGGTSNWGD